MRQFALSYYVGVFILVFLLYVNFLRAATTNSTTFVYGLASGAGAITLILIAIVVAWKGNETQ
jgi:hypothetical protein